MIGLEDGKWLYKKHCEMFQPIFAPKWEDLTDDSRENWARLELTAIGNTSVLQDWLVRIPIRMQSTLILGLRGPDTHAASGIKAIVRWMRGLAFKPGNPANVAEFMGTTPPRITEKDSVAKELEFCTHHCYTHLLQSLKVIGYCHPDTFVSHHALGLAYDLSSLLHLPVETCDEFYKRLRHLEWPGGKQPDNFQEARQLLSL